VLLLPPTNIAWAAPFLVLKIQQQQTGKCSAFASSARLHLFFISNSAISVDGSAKIFFLQGAGYPSYATDCSRIEGVAKSSVQTA